MNPFNECAIKTWRLRRSDILAQSRTSLWKRRKEALFGNPSSGYGSGEGQVTLILHVPFSHVPFKPLVTFELLVPFSHALAFVSTVMGARDLHGTLRA